MATRAAIAMLSGEERKEYSSPELAEMATDCALNDVREQARVLKMLYSSICAQINSLSVRFHQVGLG